MNGLSEQVAFKSGVEGEEELARYKSRRKSLSTGPVAGAWGKKN